MNELQTFTNDQFGSVRIKEINGEPWFVAADVCKALDISNPTDAVNRLDEDEKALVSIEGLSRGNDTGNVVSEPGLYSMVLGSRKPEAKAFKRWITHEVIPSIRKHGMWAREELLSNPDVLLEVVTRLKAESDARKALEAKNAELAPKGEYYDALVDRNALTCLRETAKLLSISEKKFIDQMLAKKFLYRDQKGRLTPYADKNRGYFQVKEYTSKTSKATGIQTMVTVKGREHFAKLFAS